MSNAQYLQTTFKTACQWYQNYVTDDILKSMFLVYDNSQ